MSRRPGPPSPRRGGVALAAAAALLALGGDQTVAAEGDIRLRRPARGGGGGGSGTPTPPRTCTRWVPDFTGESGGSLGLVPC